MPDNAVLTHLLRTREEKGGGLLVLIDPDRTDERACLSLAEAAFSCGVDALLVGTSFMLNSNFREMVGKIKATAASSVSDGQQRVPIIIFPGSAAQVAPDADAILFTSLISGRNPSFLIDEQVKGAPLIKRYGVEPIPTGYMLIESGPLTSVQYISGTMPIPRDKTDIACAHALAAQYLGMRLVYLEAGSGAESSVPIAMVEHVSDYIDIPVVVGGGIRHPDQCAERIAAGAGFVVVGNGLEGALDMEYIKDLAAAVHPRIPVSA